MDYGKIRPRLTIRAAMMFENMTGVRINDAGRKAEEDPELSVKLLYCALAAGGLDISYVKALPLLAGQTGERCAEMMAADNEFASQFLPAVDTDKLDGAEVGKNETADEPWICDIVPVLVKDCGLDVGYVLDGMRYTDITPFLRYREDRMRAETEDKRLWTYLTVAPHLNPKKKVTPETFLPLPWEKERKVREFRKNERDMTIKLKELGILKEKDGNDNEK